MTNVTLAIAFAASALALCLRPTYGLIVYIAVLVWYPPYLTIPIGTIDFNANRIVILALYANILFRENMLRGFRLILLDKLVVVYFLGEILALSFTTPVAEFLENRAGACVDTLLPYFAVRMIIKTREHYVTVLKSILFIAAPLAIAGFYQCITGVNPVGFLRKYHAWKNAGELKWNRYGFWRAEVTFPMSIMYGLFFATFGPACLGIKRILKKHVGLFCIGLGLVVIGIFSSMSTGPMLAAILAFSFILFYRWRQHWKTATIIIVIMCSLIEVGSNRHFYDVFTRFALNSTTAYYRGRLVEVALFEGGMAGHWICGYGFADPGWGPRITGYSYTDIVNHYVKVLANYGLVGFALFVPIIFEAVRRTVRAFKDCVLAADRWLVWCLASSLFGLLAAMNSVSLFGQPITCFYLLLGFCAIMPTLISRENKRLLTQPLHGSYVHP